MSNAPTRDMIFISHATEDNEFTLWLALQLAKEGYGVWCDLTKLLGGENWPREINQALQTRTQKFLFVLSQHSNQKDNPMGELTAAFNIMKTENLSNFIVPLKVDDLEYPKIDFRLQNVQSILFDKSWADGLSQLLKMLNRDGVRKHPSFTPETVTLWWENYKSSTAVINAPELLASNRYPIISFPTFIFAHQVSEKPQTGRQFIPYTFMPFKQYVLSFAEAEILTGQIRSLKIEKTEKIDINAILDGTSSFIEDSKHGNYIVTRLFNQVLWKGLQGKGLLSYNLSNKKTCYYFHEKLLSNGKIIFSGDKELSSQIKLWGKTLNEKWYWAVRGCFESKPLWHYNIQYHILVSDITGEKRPAPKRVYSRWNNSTWRDKLRASMLHLAGEDDKIVFKLGNEQEIRITKDSMPFNSPVSFVDPNIEDEDE